MYEVEVTLLNMSSVIGLAEHPHCTIAACVHTMPFAARLELKYWPYVLQYYVLIHNCLPHGSHGNSAYTICTDQISNFTVGAKNW